MTSSLKRLAKRIASSSGLWMAWDYYDRNRKLKLMKQRGDRSIVNFDMQSKKTSDQIFILGGGYSINHVTELQWKMIKAHDSFGFNTWCFHPHVPTYYGLETPPDLVLSKKIIDKFNQKKSLYADTTLFIQYQHFIKSAVSYEGHFELPKEQVYYFAPYTIHTTNKYLLRKAIIACLDDENANLGDIIHYAGSLSYVIMMCYLMGYKEIVLLGIDLSNPHYWFMKDSHDESINDLAQFIKARSEETGRSKKGGSHMTIDRRVTSLYGSLPIDEYLKILKEELKKRGVTLFIGSKESKLYPLLPYYEFSNPAKPFITQ